MFSSEYRKQARYRVRTSAWAIGGLRTLRRLQMSKIKQYIADVYGEDADLEILSQEREEQDGRN